MVSPNLLLYLFSTVAISFSWMNFISSGTYDCTQMFEASIESHIIRLRHKTFWSKNAGLTKSRLWNVSGSESFDATFELFDCKKMKQRACKAPEEVTFTFT
jgi:hypothetical protein